HVGLRDDAELAQQQLQLVLADAELAEQLELVLVDAELRLVRRAQLVQLVEQHAVDAELLERHVEQRLGQRQQHGAELGLQQLQRHDDEEAVAFTRGGFFTTPAKITLLGDEERRQALGVV